MHHYIPLNQDEKQQMLSAIGVESVAELFSVIPAAIREKYTLPEFAALSEVELKRYFTRLGNENTTAATHTSFLGGGAYQHYVPSAVGNILARGDFFSAYTPYQPEVSQGTLHALYEFQSYISALSGLPVVNASMYDGGSALAEAVLMAQRVTGRKKVILAGAIHPHYVEVVRTYTQYVGVEIVVLAPNAQGTFPLEELRGLLDSSISAVVVQSPNFFGLVENLAAAAEAVHAIGGLLIATATEAMSLGLLNSPGSQGADLFAGEGQSLGLSVSYGGPYLGLFASRKKFIRQMPGRLCGRTVDAEGRPGFVLTLSTREQHIRREKATSNICTNQGLCALASTVYLSLMGKQGIGEAATNSAQAAHYLRSRLAALPGYRIVFSGNFFNEFLVELPEPAAAWCERLAAQGYLAGIPVGRFFPGLLTERTALLCATELHDKATIDSFIDTLAGVAAAR